jgi:hypothetical protein
MKSSKKKILVFVDWYLPGYKAGGPIKSCVGLVDRLSDTYEVKIVTGNTDLKDTKPYKGIVSDTWNKLNTGTEVFYCSAPGANFKNFSNIILQEQPDIIYLNSMYSVATSGFKKIKAFAESSCCATRDAKCRRIGIEIL